MIFDSSENNHIWSEYQRNLDFINVLVMARRRQVLSLNDIVMTYMFLLILFVV